MDDPIDTVEPLLIRRPVASTQKKKYYPSRGLIYFLLNLLFLSAVSVFLVTYLKDHEKRSHQVVGINIQFSDDTPIEDPSIVTLLDEEGDSEDTKVLSRQNRHLKTLPDNSTFSSQEAINTSDNSTSSQHRIVACYDLTDEKEPTEEQLSMLTHIIFYPMEIYSNGTITGREDTKEKFERLVKKAKQFNVKVMISTVLLREWDMKMVETYVDEKKKQNETDLKNAEVKDVVEETSPSDQDAKMKELLERIIGAVDKSKMSFTFSLVKSEPKGMAMIMMREGRRRNFLNSILDIIEHYNLDGVDVHWRWSHSFDHETKIILLCKELREKLTDISTSISRTDPYTISVATGLSVQDPRIKEVSESVDFINIEADHHYSYGFGGFGEARGATNDFLDERDRIEHTLRYYSCLTKSPGKLNLVIRFYGLITHGFRKISVADCDKMHEQGHRRVKRRRAPIRNTINESRESPQGLSSREEEPAGFQEPFECVMARNAFSIQMAEKNLKEKLDYLKDKKIGGVTIWRIGNDDKDNSLLKMVKAAELSHQEDRDNFLYECK